MRANHWDAFQGFTAFGESHGPAVGLVIEDVRPGVPFPFEELKRLLRERRPGSGEGESPRREPDEPVVLSGVFEGKTTGMPICILVWNRDKDSASYDRLREVFRPGHADYAWFQKFKIYDYRGGGRASGRETIARVAASSLVREITSEIDIDIRTIRLGPFSCAPGAPEEGDRLCWGDPDSLGEVRNFIGNLRKSGESCGGIVQVTCRGVVAGLGDPVFKKLDAALASAMLSIGGIKGIEFGSGFALSGMKGSQANDPITPEGFGTNHAGGILGGVSNGDAVVFRLAVKPTPSIGIPQHTVDRDNNATMLEIKGRHDTCLVPRVIPVVKAMCRLVFADALSAQRLLDGKKAGINELREAIDRVDEDILIALARRFRLAGRIGEIKKDFDRPVEDPKREGELMDQLTQKAEALGVPRGLVESLWQLIIRESKEYQK